MDIQIIYVLCLCFITKVNGQCTFQSPFASSTWRDNTRGTLTFGTTTLSGWSIEVLNQAVTQWQCQDSSSSTTIVIRSQNTIVYSTVNIYVYLCMQLTKISDYSYYYYQQHAQEGNAAYERLKFATSASLTMSDVCDSSVTVPTLEFHVLVLQGSESLAAIACGESLLYTTDYSYNDGTNTACADTTDYWDVCTTTNQMTFNYTTCSQQIAYSAVGQLTCVANMAYNGYHCSVVYNHDASVDGTATRQFSCICSSGTSASVAPDNCTAVQSPTVLPTEADGTTVTGHLLTYGTQFNYCGPVASTEESGSSNVGLIAGVVVGVLIAIGIAVGVGIYCYMRHRKNKVDEVEKPMLTNGAMVAHSETVTAHSETVTETSRQPMRRERTNLSSTTREKSDLDKSLIQRNATMTSIGLSMKREKSNITQVEPAEPIEKETEKDVGLKGIRFTFLPCFKKGGSNRKQEQTEDQHANTKSKDGPFSVLPCFNKTGKDVQHEDVENGEPKENEKPMDKEEPKEEEKRKPSGKEKAKPAKGKGEKKSAKANSKSPRGKPKSGTGKKTKDAQKDKQEDMALTDVEETETIEPAKRETTDLLGNQIPQATSTPIPKPKTSKKSPVMTRKSVSQAKSQQIPVQATNGHATNKAHIVANGKTKTEANPKSKDWTFLQCFGNRTSSPQEAEVLDVEDVHDEKIIEPVKPKASPKEKPVAKKAKKGSNTGAGKKENKASSKKEKKSPKSEETTPRSKKSSTKVKDSVNDGEIEKIKIERAKTMPERQREKTVLSIIEADKVKVDVYVPNENSPLTLKDTVMKVKEENGDLQPTEKAKSSLGLARPSSSISRANSVNSKKMQVKSTKKEKKSGKDGKVKKDKKEKKAKKGTTKKKK